MAVALANERRDNSLATADTALKRAALNKARDAQIEAQRNLATAPPGHLARGASRRSRRPSVRAADDVAVAQADLNASTSSGSAMRESRPRRAWRRPGPTARAPQQALPSARRQVQAGLRGG